ncbi:hypothetical protein EDC14_1004160 [Hydrogenispora ethanolica]|uniref:Uncharacterized protein n=1 Tax=Hydrogenispora ethanolica TaxID=1082276 RepID=A0A4R1S6Y2_HYDET|nr:hypothetical protein [Hydrogenispora ethanolica]TCL74222.1 hypothetical protein EDC14_1004160 [Hydrogenispora ethanolica]
MTIKDPIALGSLAGICGVIPQIILNLLSKSLGYSKIFSFTLAGGIFLGKKAISSIDGGILGSILWLFTAAFVGCLLVYLLRKTSTDFWWLKAPLLTVILIHLTIFGFGFNMANAKVIPKDVKTNISILVENIAFGLTAGFLITRWGVKEHWKQH